MNGRFYGGGMMPTPEQYRLREDGKVSILIFHDVGKLRGLMIFPSIFSGKHLKYTNQMTILEGKTIQVKYNGKHRFRSTAKLYRKSWNIRFGHAFHRQKKQNRTVKWQLYKCEDKRYYNGDRPMGDITYA